MWDTVFSTRDESGRSWSQHEPQPSLDLVRGLALDATAPIIDVGGGSSRLVDHLVADGHVDITVLDIAVASLAEAAARLPSDVPVHWLVHDVVDWNPPQQYAVWHDRAVFHFLVDAAQRRRYVELAAQSVRAGGSAIIATFAPDGPEQCSGLPVRRWSAEALAAAFGHRFELVWSDSIVHTTPSGGAQPFTWVMLRRSPEPD
jgi:trans-aconitate methyltransferase